MARVTASFLPFPPRPPATCPRSLRSYLVEAFRAQIYLDLLMTLKTVFFEIDYVHASFSFRGILMPPSFCK